MEVYCGSGVIGSGILIYCCWMYEVVWDSAGGVLGGDSFKQLKYIFVELKNEMDPFLHSENVNNKYLY